jgi:hypothetical protein
VSDGGGSLSAGSLDAGAVAESMMTQLTDMLGNWEAQALTLAEQGVDPRPLLAELARNLRAVADQLDGG